MKADVESKLCSDVQSLDDIDEMVGEFNKLLLETYDRYASIVKKHFTRALDYKFYSPLHEPA